MTTTIKSSPDGTQGIIQVNGVDKLTLDTNGVLLASANPSTGLRSTALATMQKFADEFGSSPASSGYQKLPSGLIIQWGSGVVGWGALGAVSFPISFPTACRIGVASVANTAAGYAASVGALFNGSMQIYHNATVNQIINFIAIGH